MKLTSLADIFHRLRESSNDLRLLMNSLLVIDSSVMDFCSLVAHGEYLFVFFGFIVTTKN